LLDFELLKVERKLKQSLELSILKRELYVFASKDPYFGTCRQVICEMFIVWIRVLKILVEKNDISGYIWHRSCIQMAKYFFLDEKIVYQSFYDALMMRWWCVSARVGKCLLSEDPRWKKWYPPFWHKSFIQTVKCSSFNQRIVYQSFYGALLTLNYFFVKEKFVCIHLCALANIPMECQKWPEKP